MASSIQTTKMVYRCCACRGATAYVTRRDERCGYCIAAGGPPQDEAAQSAEDAQLAATEEWVNRRRLMPARKRWPTLDFKPPPAIRECKVALPNGGGYHE